MIENRAPPTPVAPDASPKRSEPAVFARWDDEGGHGPVVRALSEPPPAGHAARLPRYWNETGVGVIRIGALEFHCVGAWPPGNHPDTYLDMSGKGAIRCPYCATDYVYDAALGRNTTDPAGSLHQAGS